MDDRARDRLISGLQAVLASASGDASGEQALLDSDTIRLADQLAAAAGGQDVQAWSLVAIVRWWRYQLLPEGQDNDDLVAAVGAFARVVPYKPDVVPEPVRQLLASDLSVAARIGVNGVDLAAVAGQQALAMLRDPLTAGDPEALDQAINLLAQALANLPDEHVDRAGAMSHIGAAWRLRFALTGVVSDLDEAIAAGRAAARMTPDGHPNQAGRLSNLGVALSTRFERTGSLSDLDEAIITHRLAVRSTSGEYPGRSAMLSNLGIALNTRYQCTGAIADADEAIIIHGSAVQSVPDNHPAKAEMLSNLGNALNTRFDHIGDLADLDQAIEAWLLAVQMTPANHPSLAAYHSNLGNALRTRFDHIGDLADLAQAIEMLQAAVRGTADDDPTRAVMVSNLAAGLLSRFNRVGSVADVDEVVRVLQRAAQLTPEDQPAPRANLVNALVARSEHIGTLTDLDEAIAIGRVIVRTTRDDHPDQPTHHSNLATALTARFERTGASADLDEAIDHGRLAIWTGPGHHTSRVARLSNLGIALLTRFERDAQPADVDEAITTLRFAIQLTPDEHPNRPMYLSNLGNALRQRYGHRVESADIDEAVTVSRLAVQISVPDHPSRAWSLANLGNVLVSRFHHTAAPADLSDAATAFSQALRQVSAPALIRARAGRAAATLAADLNEWAVAESLLATVVDDLLPLLTDHALGPPDRQHHLAQLQGLASSLVHATVAQPRDHTWSSRIDTAWRRLEQTRTVLLTQALDIRQTLGRLPTAHQNLATEYDEIRHLLSGRAERHIVIDQDETPAARLHADTLVERRKRAAARWPQLLDEIRQLSGHEDFALPPPTAQLRDAAGTGTVVAITVTAHGCGAMSLSRDGGDYLELPALRADDALANANAFLRAIHPPDGGRVDTAEIVKVLEWLWDVVADPVLQWLGHTSMPADPGSPHLWPRVWWIPTGALTVLPLHAAGYHHDPEGERRCVLDRVVSSYTPNVRILGDARTRTGTALTTLAVGINQTSDQAAPPLLLAEAEATRVTEWLRGGQAPFLGPRATHEAIISELPTAAWVHFACHGFVDNSDPAQSFLALYDRPLRANELFTISLTEPYLAYLSACTTGTGSFRLLDETIHLASAFQMAGFPHVIATLWPVVDRVSANIARDVYTAIRPTSTHHQPPALALHTTLHSCRARYLMHPQAWASHVHFGA